MPQTITVQEVVWPAQGKKQGRVIDTEGNSWQAWADKLGGYRVGGSYEIETKSSEFNGKTYHTIASAKPVAGGVLKADGTSGRANGVAVASAARPHEHTMDNERRRDIFVCGCINAMLGHPSIDPLTHLSGQKLIDEINKLKYVWEQTLGPNAPKAPLKRGEANEFINDEIPF